MGKWKKKKGGDKIRVLLRGKNSEATYNLESTLTEGRASNHLRRERDRFVKKEKPGCRHIGRTQNLWGRTTGLFHM